MRRARHLHLDQQREIGSADWSLWSAVCRQSTCKKNRGLVVAASGIAKDAAMNWYQPIHLFSADVTHRAFLCCPFNFYFIQSQSQLHMVLPHLDFYIRSISCLSSFLLEQVWK
jgi:hypothetical protein